MASEVNLTDGYVRVTTAAGGTQLMAQAVDVSKGDQADFCLHVLGVEGAWVEAGTFASNVTPNLAEKKNFAGLLKYARWKVKTITGGTAVTFSVRGMLRTN